MDEAAQPFERRSLDVLKDAAQQGGRLPPFVALEPEEDRRLVREILIQGSDTDSGLLGHPRRGEALRAFLGQNLNRSLQNRGDELGRAGLLAAVFARKFWALRRSVMEQAANANSKRE